MKKIAAVSTLAAVAMIGTACGQNSESSEGSGGEETYDIQLAEIQPDDYPTTVGVKEFAELVDERSDGRINIEVYSGGELGDERGVMEQVQMNSIGMTRTNASPLSEFSEEIGVLSMPYLFDSEEQMWDVLMSETGDEMLDTLSDADMQGLTFYDSGARSIYNADHSIEKPEDLEGLQIRVQESDFMVDVIEAMGATASTMTFDEVYSALETGVIDGAENNYPSYYTTNHYEVAEHYTVNEYSRVPEVLVMSKELWDQMSEEDQELLRTAAKDSVETQRESWDELEQESKEKIEENGNEIVEVEDYEPWREAVQPIYDEYEDEYGEWIEKIEEAKK